MKANLNTLGEGIRIALSAIRASKVRAGLTILGVGIGVAVVVTMAAMITGIRSSVAEGFEAAGPENFFVMPFDFSEIRLAGDGSGRPPWWNRPDLTHEEIRRIERLPAVAEATVDFDFNVTMSFEGNRVSGIGSSGNSAGWPSYTAGDFTAGRNFVPSEVQQARAVVVLSSALAEELFGQRDPIGRSVRVSARRRGVNPLFRVVGVFDLEGNVFAEVVDHIAIFPWTSAEKRLKARNPFQNFLSLVVVPHPDFPRDVTKDQVTTVLRSMRELGPGEDNNFALVESQQMIETFDQITAVFFLVMIALSSVALLVGGIGVIGIMMISVTERTREIGIRKAVGATRNEILWQFLVEASVLTFLGGAIGLGLGALVAAGIEARTPVPASIPFWSIVAALTSAIVTGMLFGLFPALRGARMTPVKALRFE